MTRVQALIFQRLIIVLSPLQISGVLRALNDNNLVTQKSNPVVITEDNEKASISLIDRVPIITTTTNQGSGNISGPRRFVTRLTLRIQRILRRHVKSA